MLKVDLGCGPSKQKGHVGVDKIKFKGVDHILDFGNEPWPFKTGSVDELYCSHALEHLTAVERVHFANELGRVLKKDGKASIIIPHWGSSRAYGDPTHQWPPVSEWWFYYLSQDWRNENAPHTDFKNWKQGFKCNLECSWAYSLQQSLQARNQEFQQFALNYYREAVYDMHVTIRKK